MKVGRIKQESVISRWRMEDHQVPKLQALL